MNINPKAVNIAISGSVDVFDGGNIKNERSTLECYAKKKIRNEIVKVTIHVLPGKLMFRVIKVYK